MSFAEFASSVTRDAQPPSGLSAALVALWHEARGDWTRAHEVVQDDHSATGAWVHAYLHRKEGDLSNASYWYSHAGRTRPSPEITPRAEWELIARELLGDPQS